MKGQRANSSGGAKYNSPGRKSGVSAGRRARARKGRSRSSFENPNGTIAISIGIKRPAGRDRQSKLTQGLRPGLIYAAPAELDYQRIIGGVFY